MIRNFAKQTNYLERQMFLDGQVTVQRFEECRYPKIQRFEEVGRGFFWTPNEINLQQDRSDHKKASEILKFIFTANISRQVFLDSLQGRGPTQVFTPVVAIPEMEALMLLWGFYETNIHSNSYSHIIRNIYNSPKEQFDAMHDNTHIIAMASNINRYYDDLHLLNCKKEVGEHVDEYEHVKAIWLALNASLGLEAIRFLASFATSFLAVEQRLYMGNGNIISLIAQDELLHTEWTTYIINQVVKDDPRFAKAKIDCEEEVYALYQDVIREEKEWADYLFSRGVVVGMNAEILKKFVDYKATSALKEIGIKLKNPEKINPLPWYNKHINISNKQTAAQESELVNYSLGTMSSEIDYQSLPDL